MAQRVSDEAVRKATGREWSEWFRILDKEGAKKKPHPEIAALLHDKYEVKPWWCQMVTVAYEQERGLREMHQKSDGFTANVSRTFAVGIDDLFAAWDDVRRRNRWLGEKLTIRKATAPKSIRITWNDGTNVDVGFIAKGDAKSSVAIEHSKLSKPGDVAAKKKFWSEAFDRLRETLEG